MSKLGDKFDDALESFSNEPDFLSITEVPEKEIVRIEELEDGSLIRYYDDCKEFIAWDDKSGYTSQGVVPLDYDYEIEEEDTHVPFTGEFVKTIRINEDAVVNYYTDYKEYIGPTPDGGHALSLKALLDEPFPDGVAEGY